MGKPDVVAVADGNPFTTRLTDPLVARGDRSAVFLHGDIAHIGGRKFSRGDTNDLAGVVSAPVVADDDLLGNT